MTPIAVEEEPPGRAAATAHRAPRAPSWRSVVALIACGRGAGPLALALRRRRGGRPRRRLPGRPVERRRHVRLYRAVYVSPLDRPAEPASAELFDHDLDRVVGALRGAPLRAGDRQMSLRNRELAEPARRRDADRRSASRASTSRARRWSRRRRSRTRAFFLAPLPRRAPRRRASPCRTPTRTCCRWPALLTAIGLTEIYRLDPTDAFRQGALDRRRRGRLRARRCSSLRATTGG